MLNFSKNSRIIFNNYRFDGNYYNRNSENDKYTFKEFLEVVQKECLENDYKFKLCNKSSSNSEIVQIEVWK